IFTCITLLLTSSLGATGLPSFGSLQSGPTRQAIQWQPAAAEITPQALRITQPGVSVRSSELPLVAGQLYDLTTTMRSGPGSRIDFAIAYTDAEGKAQTWRAVWQMPDAARPNWLPLPPRAQRYVQGFVLPRGAKHARLELSLAPAQDAALAKYEHWELTELTLTTRAAIPCCGRVGDNLLHGGDLAGTLTEGMPRGWSWLQRANTATIERVAAALPTHTGKNSPSAKPNAPTPALRVRAGSDVLLAADPVRVARGRAYHIALWVRGRGTLEVLAHPLSADRPQALRVGAPQAHDLPLTAAGWSHIERVWFAEAPHVAYAQLTLHVKAESDVELAAIELSPYTQ
ncbi:MAG: hypothetical protein ABW321_02125, partial [Polyangiales bacterium]